MTEENTPPEEGEDEDTGTEEEGTEEGNEDPPPPPKNPDLDKAIKARDRAKEEARTLKEKLAAFEKKDEADPVAVANERLVRAEVRTQLAGIGVTDRDDQKSVIDLLHLDGVDVDKNGEVDSDEIEERLTKLRRIFAGKGSGPRRPKTDTRDRGGAGDKTSDPDSARYKRILGKK